MLNVTLLTSVAKSALVGAVVTKIVDTLISSKINNNSISSILKTLVLCLLSFFIFIVLNILTILILPDATPLIGALCFGNFARESGVVDRLSDTMQNSLINIVTIFLGLGVGSKLASEQFLVPETMGIMVIGLLAFSAGTAGGVIMAKLMNLVSSKENQINPLIGAAGVSAVPMAARVVSKEGQIYDKSNILLMHAMGPNVAGVIGSAVAAGVLLSIFK